VKYQLYCPAEATTGVLAARISLPIPPMVGDELYLPQLAPEAGPGCRDYWFVVTGRSLQPDDIPTITVRHACRGHG
jgi:hypothetical protein